MLFELCLQCCAIHQPGRGYHNLSNCLSREGHFGDKKLFHLRNIKEKSVENYSVGEESTQSTPGSFGEGEINILSVDAFVHLCCRYKELTTFTAL